MLTIKPCNTINKFANNGNRCTNCHSINEIMNFKHSTYYTCLTGKKVKPFLQMPGNNYVFYYWNI